MMNTTNNEKRIEKMARKMAKIVIQMRRDGDRDGVAKLEAAAIETANQMRVGKL